MDHVLERTSGLARDAGIREYYVGLGEVVRLPVEDHVFLPSPAGIFFWETLYRTKLTELDRGKHVLDLGCGTGFIAIALALHGFRRITASDVNYDHVAYAQKQFARHIQSGQPATFVRSDLFENLTGQRFDLIAFNCPGWATPTKLYGPELQKISGSQYYSMFEGDRIAARCIGDALPLLSQGGSLLLGLNSISNIRSVLRETLDRMDRGIIISSLAKAEFPLLLYNDMWREHEATLLAQLDDWRDRGVSFFRTGADGIYWTYEVIEIGSRGGRCG